MLEGVVRGMVRTEIGVKVAQNPYADGVTHVVIVMEKFSLCPSEAVRRLVTTRGKIAHDLRNQPLPLPHCRMVLSPLKFLMK